MIIKAENRSVRYGLTGLAFSAVALSVTPQLLVAAPGTIRPGEVWPDDRGKHVQAHGGGVVKLGDSFFWFGEDCSRGMDRDKHYVGCYSSKDLAHWSFRNQVIKMSDPEDLGPGWETSMLQRLPWRVLGLNSRTSLRPRRIPTALNPRCC